MRKVHERKYSGFTLNKGESIVISMQGRTGWTELMSPKVSEDTFVNVIEVYEIEDGDFDMGAGGYIIIIGDNGVVND